MLSVSTQIAPEDDLKLFGRMLHSVAFADDITIYSFGRSDQEFRELAQKYSARIVALTKPFPTIVEVIRAREVREAKGDWVLIMDFDEIITPELQREMIEMTKSPDASAAYAIPRRNFSLGMPIVHGGFGGDYVVRLFNKTKFVDWPTNIHSTPIVKGEIVKLTGEMEHHKDASIAQMVDKTNRYSEVEAQQFFDGGLPPVTVVTLIRKPVMEFVRRYIVKRGFLDGRIGMLQSIYQAFSVFISYAKLYEKQLKSNKVERNI